MSRWKIYLAVAVAILVVIFGAAHIYNNQAELAAARGEVEHAQALARAEVRASQDVQIYAAVKAAQADSAVARAERAEKRLAAANAHATDVVAQAPDTCLPAIRAVQGARDLAVETAVEWKTAHDAEKSRADSLDQSNARLIRTVQDLDHSAGRLADASKPSFFSHLIPEVGVGAAAGVDPFTQKPAVAVGVTLSWRIN